MASELDLYTGYLKYKGIDFVFTFYKHELRLIPPENMANKIFWEWDLGETQKNDGGFKTNGLSYIDADYLVGSCNETHHRIIFFPRKTYHIGFNNSVLIISVSSFIVFNYERETIDRLSFSCQELNYIHATKQAFEMSQNIQQFIDDGIVTVNTTNYDKTTTEEQLFKVCGKEIRVYFTISRKISVNNNEPPLNLESSLIFEFEPTNDYQLIVKLLMISREFIRYLCFRRNINP